MSDYSLDRFIADARQVFASNKDPRAQAEGVAKHMKELLAVPGWMEEKIAAPANGGYSRVDLYVDDDYGHPNPGFLLMCTSQPSGPEARKAPGTGPHDHGTSWVVYGVYQGAIQQTRWRWEYPKGSGTSPQLKQFDQFVQRDGEVAFFLPGEIHNQLNVSDGRSLVLRLEGQRMDRVTRHRYNQETNSAVVQRAG